MADAEEPQPAWAGDEAPAGRPPGDRSAEDMAQEGGAYAEDDNLEFAGEPIQDPSPPLDLGGAAPLGEAVEGGGQEQAADDAGQEYAPAAGAGQEFVAAEEAAAPQYDQAGTPRDFQDPAGAAAEQEPPAWDGQQAQYEEHVDPSAQPQALMDAAALTAPQQPPYDDGGYAAADLYQTGSPGAQPPPQQYDAPPQQYDAPPLQYDAPGQQQEYSLAGGLQQQYGAPAAAPQLYGDATAAGAQGVPPLNQQHVFRPPDFGAAATSDSMQYKAAHNSPRNYDAYANMAAGHTANAYDPYQPPDGGGGGGYGVQHHAGDSALAAELVMERERHEAQLKMEAKAREELEDMILRIEKHFKAEQAARKKAEELLQQAIAAEMDANNKLEDSQKKRREDLKVLDSEREAVKRERSNLETMRQDFEVELQAARADVSRAQEALVSTEERIKAGELVERTRLENDCQVRLTAMAVEMDRMREELGMRTMVMTEEMERWRQQAHLTAASVMEAKNDVIERRKEIDATKDKMDRLLDKLHVGRERGVELTGAIAAAQFHNGASNQRMMNNWVQGMQYGAPGGFNNGGGGNAGYARPGMAPGFMMGGGPGGGGGMMMPQMVSSVPKLPPLMQPSQGGGMVVMMPAQQQQQQQQQQQYMLQQQQQQQQQHQQQQQMQQQQQQQMQLNEARRSSSGVDDRRRSSTGGGAPPHMSEGDAEDDRSSPSPYAHVQSKFAQQAAQVGHQSKAQQRQRIATKTAGSKKPDRFEEGKRDMARIAGMSRKWN